MEHIVIGILAHVDAGKTTLSEEILYESGVLKTAGRVDHQSTFLDHFALERARGITIFSKQAVFELGRRSCTLLDTPGHVDFSPETERTLQVLDYAILVVNGADGVQGHTQTLWRLLNRYQIPVFLFVNKMDQLDRPDQPGWKEQEKARLMEELKRRLDENCVDFTPGQKTETFRETLALCEETVLERYLETGTVTNEQTAGLIAGRKVFPCYFGSALKQVGVDVFLRGLDRYVRCAHYPEAFGAKVYKIARDGQGNRLTYMKLTGGMLRVKDLLRGDSRDGDGWEEKADQIRVYSGIKFETVQQAEAGMICAVTGLTRTFPGQGLGREAASVQPVLEPVLNCQVQLPEGCDVHDMLRKLRQLEEEEPMLRVLWNERLGEIHVQLMGKVQEEILKSLIRDRFGVEVELGSGHIVYKETILESVEGVGHYEPLRHYAEVHLYLEPGPRGSGLVFDTRCSEDMLDRNWQRLILTHLAEREHPGILTGAPVTDMKITLTAGRAHLKHTEGGDFRQATYRAVRQGLKKTKCMLLEPYYTFTLEVPRTLVGRAMTDIQKRNGTFVPPVMEGELAVLTGEVPVACMGDYQTEVAAYTGGMGRLFCVLNGYAPCHNEAEVIAAAEYDAERDVDNPTGSVFCAHGAGFAVSWDEVERYMHLGSTLPGQREQTVPQKKKESDSYEKYRRDEDELKAIFERTYGPVRSRVGVENVVCHTVEEHRLASDDTVKTENRVVPGGKMVSDRKAEPDGKMTAEDKLMSAVRPAADGRRRAAAGSVAPVRQRPEEYLLVDGYNMIFAWDDLKELAEINIDAARTKLMDLLCNYQGFRKCVVILVFDAYKVEGFPGEVVPYHNIHVVYTKEAETADQYIEKTVHRIGRSHQVTVATSDGLEQVIILGQGARRLSAREFREELELTGRQIREQYQSRRRSGKNYLFHYLDDDTAEYMEAVRLGRIKADGEPDDGQQNSHGRKQTGSGAERKDEKNG